MKENPLISGLFYAGAVYDAVLGIAFVVFPRTVFAWYNLSPPDHLGYVQFPGALLIVFAIMFINTARRPHTNRPLIPYMVLFKLAFAGVVMAHWLVDQVPGMWKPFAIADILFAFSFLWAYSELGKPHPA